MWYTSDREVPRGFRSSIAFRCDRPKRGPNPGNTTPPAAQGFGSDEARSTGSLSFVVHQHRAALGGGGGGGDEGGGGEVESAEAEAGAEAEVPNSLSVRLEPDGEGGGLVSIR